MSKRIKLRIWRGDAKDGALKDVEVAKNPEQASEIAKNLLGGTLVTIQTGAAGKVVSKCWLPKTFSIPVPASPKNTT